MNWANLGQSHLPIITIVCYDLGMTYRASAANPASTPQLNYIASLAKHPDAHLVPLYWAWVSQGFDLNAAQASTIIDALLLLPRIPRTAPAERKSAEPGYYTRGDDVFVVVRNQARTRTYAKQLVVPGDNRNAYWQYAPGVGAELADLTALTVDEARRLSHLHGVCVICGTRLTDPKSVERGIGPVCIKKIGGRALVSA